MYKELKEIIRKLKFMKKKKYKYLNNKTIIIKFRKTLNELIFKI